MKKLILKLNEDNAANIPISNPNDAAKMSQLQSRILQLQSQQATIQKQIDSIAKQQNDLTTKAALDMSKQTSNNPNDVQSQDVNQQQNPQQNQQQNIYNIANKTSEGYIKLTSIEEFINEEDKLASDINFSNDLTIDDNTVKNTTPINIDTPETNAVNKNYKDVIYVKFTEGSNDIIGKIYKSEDDDVWTTSCLNDNCETFQEMSFVKDLGKYGVLDKLEDFYDDVKELSEDEYNKYIVHNSTDDEDIQETQLLNYMMSLTENLSIPDIDNEVINESELSNYEFNFDDLYFSNKNTLLSYKI